MSVELTSNKQAERFGEAYPLGNGWLGAMDFGSFPQAKLALSHNTFFSGNKNTSGAPSGAPQVFQEMRALAAAGQEARAQQAAERFIGQRGNYGTNLPVGSLVIDFPQFHDAETVVARTLDLRNAQTRTRITSGAQTIELQALASHPDQVLALRITADRPVDMEISFAAFTDEVQFIDDRCGLQFLTRAAETMHCDERCGVCLQGTVRPQTDGESSREKERLQIRQATWLELFVTMQTDYADLLAGRGAAAAAQGLAAAAEQEMQRCASLSFASVQTRHQADVQPLYDAATLELPDRAATRLFAYGRYLLYSASRADSPLPAHLQGIWNDAVACRIGWTCDMHLDVNTQMNYWIADKTGLGDCTRPLTKYVEDLAVSGRATARDFYGLDGWCAELVSNAWHYTAPYWATPIAPCPACGIWILCNLYEHYQKTNDREYLREHLYPLLSGAVDFFSGYVFEQDGSLSSGPSISPENSFLCEGEKTELSNGPTFEILMIRELYTMFLQAQEQLGITDGRYARVARDRERLLPYRLTPDGALAEWSRDLSEMDPQHRHTSHLLGLYPLWQLSPAETPALCRAAAQSMTRKLTPEANYESTGWARSMLLLYEARLGRGAEAYHHLQFMMNELQEPNSLIYHPPTRGAGAFDNVYELDGNTGVAAGIAEMLLQSHADDIRLLPALPAEWNEGRFTRLIADGGVTVSCRWQHGRVTAFTLCAPQARRVNVILPEQTLTCQLQSAQPFSWSSEDK